MDARCWAARPTGHPCPAELPRVGFSLSDPVPVPRVTWSPGKARAASPPAGRPSRRRGAARPRLLSLASSSRSLASSSALARRRCSPRRSSRCRRPRCSRVSIASANRSRRRTSAPPPATLSRSPTSPATWRTSSPRPCGLPCPSSPWSARTSPRRARWSSPSTALRTRSSSP